MIYGWTGNLLGRDVFVLVGLVHLGTQHFII